MKKLILLFVLIYCTQLFAQEEKNKDTVIIQNPYRFVPKLKLFLDCDLCDLNYIQQESSSEMIDFVRDQKFADVHIMVRSQTTGSGGQEHILEYFGQNYYEKTQNKHAFSTPPTNTFSENRKLMYQNIRMGLNLFWYKHFDRYAYLIDYPDASKKGSASINKPQSKIVEPKEQKDKWDNWVFNIGLNGSLSGQETSKNSSLGSNISAKRVTEKNKFLIRASYNNSKSEFDYGEFKISSSNKTTDINLYDAFSISKHWSLGAFSDAGTSSYANQKLYLKFKPAIEYSFFDYNKSATKQITLSYRVGGVNFEYDEKTIYNKEKEFLWEHTVELNGSVQQKWGRINGSIMYDSFLNDSSLHALNFRLSTNFRITSGLSFNVSGSYAITKNQINLAGGDLSIDELLLRQKQVNSGYNFYMIAGLNYSFGSMFTSVVNPRFDF